MKRLMVAIASPLVAGLIAGCGSSAGSTAGSGTPKASPTATASPRPARLFAVLETKRSGAQYFQTHDTIAIAGADGFAVARATFTPRSIPPIFDAATVV
jgi:hypothetical protein